MPADRPAFEDVAELLAGIEIVDSHFHYWTPGHIARRDPAPALRSRSANPIATCYLPADYAKDTQRLPVAKAVHVETLVIDPVAEVRWLESLPVQDAPPFVIVAGAALEHPGSGRVLENLARIPLVHGVRQAVTWHSNRHYSYIESNLLEDDGWTKGFRQLSRFGLSFDLQIYPFQLPAAARLAHRSPDVQIILDHFGLPLLRPGVDFGDWRAGLGLIARCPNVVVKASGLAMISPHWTFSLVKRLVEELCEAVGPDRCMFGSNFPVDRPWATLDETLASYAHGLTDYSVEDRRQFFSGTAKRVYRL